MHSPPVLTLNDRKQQHLVRECYWDDVEEVLYIDARQLFAKLGVVTVIGWDRMVMDNHDIPPYPAFLKPMSWAQRPAFMVWKKQIPPWVAQSCALFPSHQLALLHYSAKYPQILELLDHAPMLAWKLIASDLPETTIVALMAGKRVAMAEHIGWPGKAETIKFLTNLRLRWVNHDISAQVETCLLDDTRLQALQNLPRINSMALSLAARFPHLINSRLHHSLARMPCRPMQCQAMDALLSDAYTLAEYLALEQTEVDKIGQARYLVEVSALYQAWLSEALKLLKSTHNRAQKLDVTSILQSKPKPIHSYPACLALSAHLQQAWFCDWYLVENGQACLVAWQDDEGVWAALVGQNQGRAAGQKLADPSTTHQVLQARGAENTLLGAKQFSTLHLWQAQQHSQNS